MTTLTLGDKLVDDIKELWLKDHPYATKSSTSPTHIVTEILIEFINNKKKEE